MKISRFVFILLTGLLLLVLFTCDSGAQAPKLQEQGTAEKHLARTWKLRRLNMGGKMVPPQVMLDSRFKYFSNGNYEIKMGNLQKGVWSFSPDKKVLYTTPEGSNYRNEIDVEFISDTLLILKNDRDTSRIRMELIPE